MIDLRSDTLTKPTAEMREAMAAAEVGDDVYGEDPTVNALEAEVAAMFGHEAALFTPTGSMANQIAVQLLVPPANELLCDADAHVVTYEIGAAAAIGGVSTRTWGPAGGDVDPAAVAAMIRPDGFWAVPTRAVAVEQTHNRAGGAVIPLATLQVAAQGGRRGGGRAALRRRPDLARPRRRRGGADGLRRALRHAVGVPVQGARGARSGRWWCPTPSGSPRPGGSASAWAAACARPASSPPPARHALSHHIGRLAEDHARARRLADALAEFDVVDPTRVRTNIVPLDLSRSDLDAPGLGVAAREAGVLVSVLGPRVGRLVTHMDVDDAGIDTAIEVLTRVLKR